MWVVEYGNVKTKIIVGSGLTKAQAEEYAARMNASSPYNHETREVK